MGKARAKGAVTMEGSKKAQEAFTQSAGKAVETLSVWTDANQRVLRELAELSAVTAKESVRLYGEIAQSMVQALSDAQAQTLRWQAAGPVAQGRTLLAQLVGLRVRRPVALRRLGRRGRRGPRRHGAPPRARRPLAEHALHVPLTRHEALQARSHRALHELLPRLAVLDELMQERRGQVRAVIALVLEDDLRERHRGQVLAARRVDHGDLAPGAHHLLDLLEGDVAALLRLVELAIRV